MGDAERAAGLLRMKRMATGLFVLVTVLFLVARTFEDRGGWVEYVRAFAEAAMVGALADWFAVTALFRHPLGLPIPHTAIIPNNKQVGAASSLKGVSVMGWSASAMSTTRATLATPGGRLLRRIKRASSEIFFEATSGERSAADCGRRNACSAPVKGALERPAALAACCSP